MPRVADGRLRLFARRRYLETVKIMDRVIKDDTTKQGVKWVLI